MKSFIRSFLILNLILLIPENCFSLTDKKPVLVLNNPVDAGLGAIFSSVLSTLNLYERDGFGGVKIDLNSGIYLDPKHGPNWWEYFFEPINIEKANTPEYVFDQGEVSSLINAGFTLTRERSYELIQQYVHLKPHLQAKIDQVVNSKFNGYFVIGIHHRGTDKKLEAIPVSYQTTLFHARWWMENLPKGTKVRLFVATDDQHFLDYVKRLYSNKVVYNNFKRSKNGDPTHYNPNLFASNYQKGEEALLDCLLLSKCQLMIFPAASAFSMMALKFNPFLTAIPLAGN